MERSFATSAWNLLSHESEVIRRRVTTTFFELFFQLYLSLKNVMPLSLRVPISVRKNFESNARKKIEKESEIQLKVARDYHNPAQNCYRRERPHSGLYIN